MALTLQDIRAKANGAYDSWPDEILRAKFNAKYPGVLTDQPSSNFSFSGNQANDIASVVTNPNSKITASDVKSYYEAKNGAGGTTLAPPTSPQSTPSTGNFDVQGALKAGYSQQEINDYLRGKQVPQQKVQAVTPKASQQNAPQTAQKGGWPNPVSLLGGVGNFLIPQTMNRYKQAFSNFDPNKSVQDKVKTAKEITSAKNTAKTALELGSFAVPGGKSIKGMALAGGVMGAMRGASEGKDFSLPSITGGAAGGALAGGLIGSATKLVGKGIQKTAEALGLKKYGLTSLDINKIERATGEDINTFMTKHGLVGKGAEDLPAVTKPLQDQFDTIAEKSGLQVDKKAISNMFKQKIAEFSSDPAPAIQNKAKVLQQYVDNLSKANSGRTLDGAALTQLRRNVDDLVTNFDKVGMDASPYRTIRSILQDSIQQSAEKTGLQNVKGQGLKEIGSDLSKLYKFSDLAEKRANKGRGTLPFGLLQILTGGLFGGAGAAVGGIPGLALGGAAGLAGEHIMNDPKVMGVLATGGAKVGEKIGQSTVLPKIGGYAGGMIGSKLGQPQALPSIGTQNSTNNNNNTNSNNQSDHTQNSTILPPISQQKAPLEGYTVDGAPISRSDAQIIDGIVNYKLDLSKITSLRSDERTRIAGLAAQYDPTWDMSQYPARVALRKDFTSGKSANNIRSLNTAIGHLQSLSQAGQNLGNTGLPLINTVKNKASQAVGNPQKTKFDNAVNAVAGEMSTVFKGSSGTDQEIKSWKDQMNSSQSPAQIQEGINQMIELMGSRLSAFDSQWTTGMGKPRDFKLLSPKSRQILENLGVDVETLDPITQ